MRKPFLYLNLEIKNLFSTRRNKNINDDAYRGLVVEGGKSIRVWPTRADVGQIAGLLNDEPDVTASNENWAKRYYSSAPGRRLERDRVAKNRFDKYIDQ